MKFLASRPSPGFLYQSKKGSIYQLTADHLQSSTANIFSLSFGHFNEIASKLIDSLEKTSNLKFKDFLGLEKRHGLMLSPYDIVDEGSLVGCSGERDIRVKGEAGTLFRSIDSYISFAAFVSPEILIPLYEPLTSTSGKKGVSRAIEKNRKFLNEMLESKEIWSKGNPQILVPLVLNSHLHRIKEQAESISKVGNSKIAGIALCGLEHLLSFTDKSKAIGIAKRAISPNTPEEEELIMMWNGNCTIPDILFGIYHGIEFFTVDEPFAKAEAGFALDFAPVFDGKDDIIDNSIFEGKSTKTLDLNSPQYSSDSQPLLNNCSCHTCSFHTRAYINHLLSCSEMTGNVLLCIHNLFVYESLLTSIREQEDPMKCIPSLLTSLCN